MTKKKILIVDDEKEIRELFCAAIESEEFECLNAKDGLEGLDAALTIHPDLILLDIKMPSMDGISMLKKLREHDKTKDIPVIVLSSFSDEEVVSVTMEFGVSDFIEKPTWSKKELIDRIRHKLEMKK